MTGRVHKGKCLAALTTLLTCASSVEAAPLPFGDGASWFAATSRGAPEDLARELTQRAQEVLAEIDNLEARFPTSGVPVVTGFSQGGMLSFAIATVATPDQVALALPLGGGLPEPMRRPATIPVQAYHGVEDDVIPVDWAIQTSEALQVPLTQIPGLKHGIDPRLHQQWRTRLQQQLVQRPTPPG